MTASYRRADGAVAIVGNDGMRAVLEGLNALMARTHPGLVFDMTLEGSSTGLPALAAGATLLAPLTRWAWLGETAGFRQIRGYDATPIRIGYSGWGPRFTGKTPPAVYVHGDNPIASLDPVDLVRVFTAGHARGDVGRWSQLGVAGDHAERGIHLYGLRDDGGSATSFRLRFLDGLPFAARYEPLASNAAIIRAVAEDRFGIGITGWVQAEKIAASVRVVPIGAAALPTRADVAAGLYPLSMPVVFYLDAGSDGAIDPLAVAYAMTALSDDGQALLAAQADSPEGYLPLSPADRDTVRASLEELIGSR